MKNFILLLFVIAMLSQGLTILYLHKNIISVDKDINILISNDEVLYAHDKNFNRNHEIFDKNFTAIEDKINEIEPILMQTRAHSIWNHIILRMYFKGQLDFLLEEELLEEGMNERNF